MNIFQKLEFLIYKLYQKGSHCVLYQKGLIYTKSFAYATGANKDLIFLSPSVYLKGEKYMQIKGRFFVCRGVRIECIDNYHDTMYHPKLFFGDGVTLGFFCHIAVINEVIIGNNVLFGSRVLVTDHSHGRFCEEERDIPYEQRTLYSKGPIHIEDNVWLGENVCVLPGVTIGKGSTIGANSVVTHDIPAYSMAVGAPAKVIRQLQNK